MRHVAPVRFRPVVCAAALSFALLQAAAQPASIRIGFTTPLSGPNAAYGSGLLLGAQVAAAAANAAGGIGGRPLELVAMDDGGDARRAAGNARRLIDSGVVALSGVHGSAAASAVAAEPALGGQGARRVPLVGPATSADSLRDPPQPGVFHLRAGSTEEASAAALHFDTIGITRVAVLAQDDPLGRSARASVQIEMMRMAMRPVASEGLAVDDDAKAVLRAMQAVCAARPELVILAVDAQHALQAVDAGRAAGCTVRYLTFSETGAALSADPTLMSGHPALEGLLVTQVVPHPRNLSNPLVAEYQRALAAHGSKAAPDLQRADLYPAMEGYLALRGLQEALLACSRDPGRVCLLQALETRTFQLPGLQVHFGAAQRLAKPFVELTFLDGRGKFRR